MKKAMILLCGLLLVSGAYAAGSQMNFGINFGIMTDDGFSFDPLLWTAGAELDFQFGELLMFSPEVTLVGNGFKFESFWLYPAALLNFTPGNFFVGGGLTKGFLIGDSVPSVSTDVPLKLNKAKNYLLPVSVVMPGDWEVVLTFRAGERIVFRGAIRFDV